VSYKVCQLTLCGCLSKNRAFWDSNFADHDNMCTHYVTVCLLLAFCYIFVCHSFLSPLNQILPENNFRTMWQISNTTAAVIIIVIIIIHTRGR